MTVTAQRLLTELGRRAWSGFNADDMVFGSDDANQAKAELNAALRYLINLRDFPFRSSEQNLITRPNSNRYTVPVGQITSIYNKETLENLVFSGDGKDFDKSITGKPTHYWIDYSNPDCALKLYPTPDKAYKYAVVYNQYKPVLNEKDSETYFEFENATDRINMPENLEYLFMDCLVLRTMVQNIVDDQDENFAPLVEEFNQVWKVFVRTSRPARINKRIIW